MAKELMNQSEYAKHRGVSQPCINKYIRSGKIPNNAIKKGLIDVVMADTALDQNLDPSYRQPGPAANNRVSHIEPAPAATTNNQDPSKQSLNDVRTLKEKILAEDARINLELKKKNLIHRQDLNIC